MVLGFALNLGAFISSVTLHSYVFILIHYVLLLINSFALPWVWLICLILLSLPDSSLLQPSYYYHLSNLYITYITSFVLLSCISLCTLIPNKAHSSIIPHSNQCLLYLFLFSSILIYILIYHQPNPYHRFSLFHLLIFFNHRLTLHSLLHTTQSDSHYLLHTLHCY